jgi:phosphoserine phosphatase
MTHSKTPRTVRLAALLPAPFSLSDYEPLTPVGSGTYGIASLADVTDVSYRELVANVGKAFRSAATLGYCPVAKVQAVFFDMDSTVIAQESIVELAAYAGKAEEVAHITERAMQGELDFKESLRARVATLKGLPETVFAEVGARLTLMKGIQQLVGLCRELRVPTYMVSGGFIQLAEVVQKQIGFTGIRANILDVVGGHLTGHVRGEIVDADVKQRFLRETCKAIGVDPKHACAVGDGANDLKMMDAAGVAVGFMPKPVLIPHLHALNAVGDHAFLAPLLYGRDPAGPRRK